MRTRTISKSGLWALSLATAAFVAGTAGAAEINVYSSRHYQTDEKLYGDFTKQTGIKINRIEGSGDKLIARLKSEGKNSPADVLITVDAGNLWRADKEGLFQGIKSDEIEKRVPANLRHPKGHWIGFSSRARLIFVDKAKVQPGAIKSYEDLADPKWKGKVCIRSSSNMYNLSLMGSLIAHHGEAKAESWAKGVVANFARQPKGGDTDQIKAIGAGECEIAVANSYYFIRLVKSAKDADKKVVAKVNAIFPNQENRGTHVNISGAGIMKNAPHKAEAVKFLEYLTSPSAQEYFASGNNEYPAVAGVKIDPALAALGDFKADKVNVAVYGENQPTAQKVYDRAGWK